MIRVTAAFSWLRTMVKRILLWILALLAGLGVAVALAFLLTPWPSVALIQFAFARGDRAAMDALEKHVPPEVVTRGDLAYGAGPDERFDLHLPRGAAGPLRAIVWVHGGGWVAGSKEGVANYLKVLAGHGYAVVGIEYARGFGVTYPQPVEQVNRALGYIVEHAAELGIDAGPLVLAGDSAGAQIAAQLALMIGDPGYAAQVGIAPAIPRARLAAVLLLSGAFDIGQMDPDSWFANTVGWAYSGRRDFRNDARFQLVSVANHVTAAFPPAFISSGNGDPLAPQAVALAAKLEGLGVAVDSLFFPAGYAPSLPHEYQFNLDGEAGQEALARLLVFVDRARP
jgi:acetyl esterase/lipase